MMQWLESEYEEMHGSRGKRHYYLGMWLDYSITIIPEGSTRQLTIGYNRYKRNTHLIKPLQHQG